MLQKQALSAFAALSQVTRLKIVRALVVAGADGMAAGTVADAVGVSASNVSFHLKELEHAGLIDQKRVSRSIVYSASYERLSELVRFLMEDCCAGHPDIIAPAGETPRTCSTSGASGREDVA